MSTVDCYDCDNSGRGDEYEVCASCDHFIEPVDQAPGGGLVLFMHLDDGEKEHDHDAAPSGDARLLHQWMIDHPLRFVMYPDHKIGPNSEHYVPGGTMEVRPPA